MIRHFNLNTRARGATQFFADHAPAGLSLSFLNRPDVRELFEAETEVGSNGN